MRAKTPVPAQKAGLRLVSALLTAAMLFTLLPTAAFAAEIPTEGVLIAEAFPDSAFRAWIELEIDSDHNGLLSPGELAATTLNLSEKGISDLTGIECFTHLTVLNVNGNNLTSLDLSGNPELTVLECADNDLHSLKLGGNPELLALNCDANALESLDISANTKLTRLQCQYNQLTELDVNGHDRLETLQCNFNALERLDVSGCTELMILHCKRNQLTALDLRANPKIESFDADMQDYTVNTSSVALTDLPGQPKEERFFVLGNGGTLSGGVLTFAEGSTSIGYEYKCDNNGHIVRGTLTLDTSGTEEPEQPAPTYQITVSGGKAYGDAARTIEITEAEEGETVWIEADDPDFAGHWTADATVDVAFDDPEAASTSFTMPAVDVEIRAVSDAKPDQGGDSGDTGTGVTTVPLYRSDSGAGSGLAAIAAGGAAILGSVIVYVLVSPVKVNGYVVRAENRTVVPGAAIQLMKNGAVAASAVAGADGSYALRVKSGDYVAVVTSSDENGESRQTSTLIHVGIFGARSLTIAI